MTTREVEKNVLKCHRYWPESDVKKVGFGILQVEHLSTASHTYHIERRFRVTCDGQEGSLEVTQLCYQSWPDHVGKGAGVGD
jgi:protein tyrosine phosphatase